MSTLLLDTHVALWWLAGDPLSPHAVESLTDPQNRLLLSIASAWEIAIKQSLGRLETPADYLDVLDDQGVELLGITRAHTERVRDLPPHHRDPFDRMLVGQASAESATLVTRDSRLADYPVSLLAA